MPCFEKLPHSCGSSDGLQTWVENNKFTGYCFSCNTYVADPYGTNPPKDIKTRSKPNWEEVKEEILSYPSVALPNRGLPDWVLKRYDCHVALSEENKEPVVVYFPVRKKGELTGYKARLLADKKMWCYGDVKEPDLFGQQEALSTGAPTLYITEGEFDAMALYYALKEKARGTKWEHLEPAVVSLPHGASAAKRDALTNLVFLGQFNSVVLAFDMDEAGDKAAADVQGCIGTAKRAVLPDKDANACVLNGKLLALCNSVVFKATTVKNTRLVWGNALYEEGRKQAEWGLSWPWPSMTALTRGMRFGETIYIGAGVKMGKSEIVNTLGAHLITEHGVKIFMAKPEETNRKTYQLLLGKIAGKIFHDPEIPFDYDAYDEAHKQVNGMVAMLNLYQHLDWSMLKTDILSAWKAGCRAVFIDPITNLTNGIQSGQANTVLQEIAQELAAMAKDLDILIFIFCHLKSPDSGPAHERGGEVLSHQFAGSRAMMRSCNLMLGLQGNKDPKLGSIERNTRQLVLLEDREFGATGIVNLYWDPATSIFNEID